jgi:hypothetical protein
MSVEPNQLMSIRLAIALFVLAYLAYIAFICGQRSTQPDDSPPVPSLNQPILDADALAA